MLSFRRNFFAEDCKKAPLGDFEGKRSCVWAWKGIYAALRLNDVGYSLSLCWVVCIG